MFRPFTITHTTQVRRHPPRPPVVSDGGYGEVVNHGGGGRGTAAVVLGAVGPPGVCACAYAFVWGWMNGKGKGRHVFIYNE